MGAPNHDESSQAACSTTMMEHCGAPTPTAAPSQKKPRLYFMDWLRVFLTVVVIAQHCVETYSSGDGFWKGQAKEATQDMAVQGLSIFFILANETYFMGLFFMLVGYCTPGSYTRKGPARYMVDRTLRLLLPAAIYSIFIPALNDYINWGASSDPMLKSLNYGNAIAYWLFTPGKWQLPRGPVWFVVLAWWFSVAYVLVRMAWECKAAQSAKHRYATMAAAVASKVCRQHKPSSSKATPAVLPVANTDARVQEGGAAAANVGSGVPAGQGLGISGDGEIPLGTLLWWCISVVVLLTVSSWAARMAQLPAQPLSFTWTPVIAFQADLLPQFVVGFILGIYAYPRNGLMRLPARCGWVCLAAAAVWWVEGCFVPFLAIPVPLVSIPSPGSSGFAAAAALTLYRCFAECCFGVAWSLGLLVLFREQFNEPKPNRLGQIIIGAAYGVYLIHPPFVAVWGRALSGQTYDTFLVNACALVPLVSVSCWIVAAVLRAVPWVDHVL